MLDCLLRLFDQSRSRSVTSCVRSPLAGQFVRLLQQIRLARSVVQTFALALVRSFLVLQRQFKESLVLLP